jgi:hypothetical protein
VSKATGFLPVFLLAACGSVAPAAEGVITLLPSGKTFGPASVAELQKALSEAKCGDTIQIQAGAVITFRRQQLSITHRCQPGKELVITTSQPERLPDETSRITPSYRPVLPMFIIEDTASNQPPFLLDSTQSVPSGIKFVGIGLESRVPAGKEPYTLFQIGPANAKSKAELPSNIVFDRVYFTGDLDPAKRVVTAFYLVASGVTIQNSFFDDFHRGPNEEGYVAYVANDAPGPFVFRNNYFGSGSAIPILSGGGGGPSFAEGQPHPTGFVVEHNHFYNSLKFYPGTPYYVGDANRPCIKNFFEIKQGSDVVVRWNSGENAFNGCGAQGNGFVFTVRNIALKQGGRATVQPGGKTVTIANAQSLGGLRTPRPGYALGIARRNGSIPDRPGPNQIEWRTIQSVSGTAAAMQITVDQPFPTETVSPSDWALAAIPWGRIANVMVEGNFLMNVPNSLLTLGVDDFFIGGGLKDLTYRNNLTINSSPYFQFLPGKQEWVQGFAKLVNGGENITIDHNTFVVLPSIHADGKLPRYMFQQEQGAVELGNKTNGLHLRNNLLPWGEYGIVSSGITPATLWNERNDAALEFRTNLLYQMPTGPDWKSVLENCQRPRVCQGNVFAPEKTVLDDNLGLLRYKGTAQAKTDPGVDLNQIPRLRVAVQPQSTALNFQYQMPTVLASQSCALEVSADRGLISDTAAYQVVASLRPDQAARADSDRFNSKVRITDEGRVRQFPVEGLQPNQTYFYRLMCGGAVERGSVKTTP